ncbi:MAG: amidohydrolase [Myxococcales bacterium]|nr:amidohydrolase [Myxococcales bacterium]
MSIPLRFESSWAFCDTPYFERRDGRLVLATKEIGPIVDVHTHLALSFAGRKPTVDLRAASHPAQHYLPLDRPVDIGLYGNKSFSAGDLKRLKHDLGLQSITDGGMRATHTAPNLLREMEELGISHSVLLPIDFPKISANYESYLAIARDEPRFIGFGSVHPFDGDPAKRLDEQLALGARGIKVHPAVQMFYPDTARALKLYRLCGERGLPVLTHCGPVGIETRLGRHLTQLRYYPRTISECPETTFILGHTGALQMEPALELGKRYPNVYLDVSCQSYPAVERIVNEGPEDRLLLGSDWPFYHQSHPILKVLAATEGRPGLRRKVLYDNAARLFGLPPRDA